MKNYNFPKMYTTKLFYLRTKKLLSLSKIYVRARKFHHNIPFVNFYEKITGIKLEDNCFPELQKKHPNILKLSKEDLKFILDILKKFDISAEQACNDPHLFSMNPISMDNYGEILKECKFTSIQPKYIIRYHTMVKSKTISKLKNDGVLKDDLNLEETLFEYFNNLPTNQIVLNNFEDSKTNIVTIRMSVLEKYLNWKLGVTNDEFKKYCKNYLPLRHRPYEDILESLNVAENNIKFNTDVIRRNGFIISSDPTNTKLILENVISLAGLDIREVIRLEPAILKNNYQSLLQIKDILKEYNVSEEAQYRCLRVFCMQPKTVRERLEEITSLKEYPILSTNSRMLYMVVHEKKMIDRLNKIREAQKQCYSFNLLVSSRKVFNTYLNSFGAKVCGNDVGAYINASLHDRHITTSGVLKKLKRHKYWLHTALDVIADNIQMLKREFKDEVIFNNCQILLYPSLEIEKHINCLTQLRKGDRSCDMTSDASYNNLDCSRLTDNQLLSLVLYEMEKGYHFSGDGIWNNCEARSQQNEDTLQTSAQTS